MCLENHQMERLATFGMSRGCESGRAYCRAAELMLVKPFQVTLGSRENYPANDIHR